MRVLKIFWAIFVSYLDIFRKKIEIRRLFKILIFLGWKVDKKNRRKFNQIYRVATKILKVN